MIEMDKLKSIGKKIENKLIAIRESVGAELGEFNIAHDEFIIGEDLWELAQLNPGKPIIINGEYRHAYIKDHSYHGLKSKHDQEVKENSAHCFTRGNKVHFYYCKTLSQMRNKGRYDRYRAARKISNSKIIDLRNAKNVETRLAWCQNCLDIFPGKGGFFTNKSKMAQNGDAQELMDAVRAYHDGKKDLGNKHAAEFRDYKRGKPIPIDTSHVGGLKGEFDPAGYPSNWRTISRRVRKKCGYRCAQCGVDCSAQPGLTDAHHINGDKSDCHDDNLQCLCKLCHAKQGFHTHYKPKEEDKQKLRQLQQEQNIPLRG